MISIEVYLSGDGIWPDLADKMRDGKLVEVKDNLRIAALPDGTTSGKPSVSIRLDLPDGTVVLAQTSLALFLAAADGIRGQYGNVRPSDGRSA